MNIRVNPVPAWKAAPTGRRVIAAAMYLAAVVLPVALLVAGLSVWPAVVLALFVSFLLADSAHVVLRGSTARNQVLESLRPAAKKR